MPLTLLDRRGLLPTRADGTSYRTRRLQRIVGVAIHATETDSSAEELALFQTTKVEGDPYPAIAYHHVVHPDGLVEWCLDLEVEAWHAGSPGSATHLSVCLAGAAGDEGPTESQLGASRELVAELEKRLGRPLAIRPHHELLPAAARCPGPGWATWGKHLVGSAGRGVGEG